MTLLVVKKSAGLHQALFLIYSDPIYLWRLLPLLCLCPYILGTNGPSHSNFCLSGEVPFDRELCFKLVEKYQGWLLPGESWPPHPWVSLISGSVTPSSKLSFEMISTLGYQTSLNTSFFSLFSPEGSEIRWIFSKISLNFKFCHFLVYDLGWVILPLYKNEDSHSCSNDFTGFKKHQERNIVSNKYKALGCPQGVGERLEWGWRKADACWERRRLVQWSHGDVLMGTAWDLL